jgi:metal-responsive CopG/Arc/MetJ family transcriptional regulator
MNKNTNQVNYVTLKIPKTLADEIDKMIESKRPKSRNMVTG